MWSFSRVESYERCPLSFYYQYIKEYPGVSGAFAEYGSFIHLILEKYALNKLELWDLSGYYKKNYRKHITTNFPPNAWVDLGERYYYQGLEYFNNFEGYDREILAVEKDYNFKIGKYNFRGIVDLECPGEIIDIKTKKEQHLTRLTKRHDKEDYITMLDGRFIHKDNFKQLYIYSIPFKETYGEYPKLLSLCMVRANDWYTVKFDRDLFDEAYGWAIDEVTKIYNAKEFPKGKDISEFWCEHICGQRLNCEYSNAYLGDVP